MMIESKIAIISGNSLKYSPYIDFYQTLFSENIIPYVIINKERDEHEINTNSQYAFIQTQNILNENIIARTLKWYKFVKNVVKQQNCNKLVVTPTRTGIILFPILMLTKNKYIFDIRDYTKESNIFYRYVEKMLLDKASLVVISSEGFKKWMPLTKTKVCVIHNMKYNAVQIQQSKRSCSGTTVTISYIGMIGYYETNRLLIDAFINDPRYVINYSGKVNEDCDLIKYAKDKNAQNVIFTGEYNNSDKGKLYENTDMINAIYGNENLIVTSALPNKLYDAAIYYKPIIASKGTFLGELIEKFQLGVTVANDSENIRNTIDQYLQSFDFESFKTNCDDFMRIVNEQQLVTIEEILKFVK